MGLFKRKNNQNDNVTENPVFTPTPPAYDEQVQNEARRLHVAAMTLSANEEQKARDGKRLGEVKQESITASIRRVHKLWQWLNTYTKLTQTMKEHSERMYKANKQLAANTEKEKELERFETLESIQGLYQRIRLLEEVSHENKQALTEKANALEMCRQTEEEEKKLMAQRAADLSESEKQMTLAAERLEQAYRIQGAHTILELDIRSIQDTLNLLSQQRDALKREADDRMAEIAELREAEEKKNLQKQALEPHRNMLAQGKQVLFCLDILGETKAEIQRINTQHEECSLRQRDESNLLERTFAEYQRVEADILTLNSELQRHRMSLTGTNSYDLQKRAMQQETQRQMLLSAQALWSHIQDGYREIDEQEQELTQLKNKTDYDRQTLETLGKEVEMLRNECKAREYTLTVSKSQNVIQLRSELKEGVSCTVCGATHHPYHSDTMLEQNKLISELKSEYELQAAELQTKERTLSELRQTMIRHEEELKQKSSYLIILRNQQETFVKEWAMYNELDRSFGECSPSTNLEARTGMIRQLIVNATHDADVAQHELDTYNYHQTQINEISESLTKKEQEKSELTIRLNEANTGCQVLTRQIAILEEIRSAARTRYTRLYEKASKTISLPEWLKEWESNPEGLKQHIAELTDSWNALNKELDQLRQKQEIAIKAQEGCQRLDTTTEKFILLARKELERCTNLLKEGEKTNERLLEGKKAEEYAEMVFQQFRSNNSAAKEQQESLTTAHTKRANAEGQEEELQAHSKHIDELLSAGHMELDLWIRQYNTSHPSIQYKDLEQYFSGKEDWNELRKIIREARIQAVTEQNITNLLRNDILEMQAIASQSSTDINLLTSEGLQSQLSQLEQQYREACLETATHIVTLQRNEKYKRLSESGEEK